MPINNVMSSGLEGFNRASKGIEQASLEINKASAQNQSQEQLVQQRQLQAASTEEAVVAPVPQPTKVDESLINLKLEEMNAKANTQSIKTADEVLGTLIDIKV
jgi:hypothetical protein